MHSNVILVRGDLVWPREAFDQLHRRTTQGGGEELSQILTPYHRMRGSLSRLRTGKTSTEGILKHLLWTEAYPGEEEPFLLANKEDLGLMIFATDRDLYLAAHSKWQFCAGKQTLDVLSEAEGLSIEVHIERMEKNRTFMTDFELQMAALALNITIYVYSPNHTTKWSDRPTSLMRLQDVHFDPIYGVHDE
ncbi:hypothetical protein L596_005127 [Steinernema carpocapsae]|uniref:Uncharacterized protein n=1 Tax=Steinernema carpocapsae TaxID=34508 RepID=A0A4U8UXZ0_STECR|nr:hypothetical protein L596_005127 [Steinernema carpocapsae]